MVAILYQDPTTTEASKTNQSLSSYSYKFVAFGYEKATEFWPARHIFAKSMV